VTAAPSKRNAWLLVGGQSVSTLGDGLLVVVLPLMVLDVTGSAIQVSIIFILTQLPTFFGTLSGRLRRRFAPRELLVAYDSARAGLLLTMAGLMAISSNLVYVVYVLVFAVGIFTAVFEPTRIEFITYLAPEGALTRFNSYDRTLEALAIAGGAGLAGYLYHLLPVAPIFLVDAGTFAVSALSLLAIRATPATAGVAGIPAVEASFRAAVAAARRRQATVFLLGGETLTGVAFGMFGATFVVYARRYLHVDSIMYGNFEMVQALAATVTGFYLGAGRLRVSDRGRAVIGYLGMGLAFVCLGLNGDLWPVFPLMVALGLTNMLYAVSVRTLLQTTSPQREVVHVFALESVLSRTAAVVGAAIGGTLVGLSVLRVNWTILAAGSIVIVVAAWGYRVLVAPAGPATRGVVAPDA
jgi:MFS family permease